MQMKLIKNDNDEKIVQYKIARIVFAETCGDSLPLVEAMAGMIYNIHTKYNKPFCDIIRDENIFESLNPKSKRHDLLNVSADNKRFQMCLRVVQTMMHGNLRDIVFGATRYHHTDVMPQWAIARGYIAEYSDILFYL